ncbi:MAG: DUF4124 domain-containing protein [Piscinibacter sp.]|uniref:DUF4124 domain-containing protein n=1 Tax=Piscinibacter sp. TaxID=1903157 RepID=UPI001B6B69E0|nr:DUF4124 domain-containing protein [Piscinibacter sp.]MBP5989356.1 DUF4124 domain-containing protein [Piscinibacter sp.]MBP6026940.1 DUF4124 domain-containing protein [Piscinibacter sp.]
MRFRLTLLSIALAGATLALPAAAQWKWRGANGQIQYSDLPPPPGVSEKDILSRPTPATLRAAAPAAAASPAASGAAQPAKAVDPELEAKRKKAEQEDAAKAKADEQRVAAAKAENCKRARDQIRALESGMRMARVNEKGEREVLDDKMRADEMKRARDLANADCAK